MMAPLGRVVACLGEEDIFMLAAGLAAQFHFAPYCCSEVFRMSR